MRRAVTMVEKRQGRRYRLGWSAAITQDRGRLVLSASGEGVAFVVFGACAALVNVQVLPE